MSLDAIKLRIQTPIECLPPGRGFYQRDEDSLYVQVGAFSERHRFFSFLESPSMRLDLDRDGRLVFVEVTSSRRQWVTNDRLVPPASPVPADIHFLDFRSTIASPRLLTDPRGQCLAIVFSDESSSAAYHVSHSVIVQTAPENVLTAIWVTEIDEDSAGVKLAAFRRANSHPILPAEPQSPFLRLPA